MFFKKIVLLMSVVLLTGCIHLYRPDIQQGNVFTEQEVKRLHVGMTQDQVKQILGEPVLTDTFSPHRINYVYTFYPGIRASSDSEDTTEKIETLKHLTLLFQNGRLQRIETG